METQKVLLPRNVLVSLDGVTFFYEEDFVGLKKVKPVFNQEDSSFAFQGMEGEIIKIPVRALPVEEMIKGSVKPVIHFVSIYDFFAKLISSVEIGQNTLLDLLGIIKAEKFFKYSSPNIYKKMGN